MLALELTNRDSREQWRNVVDWLARPRFGRRWICFSTAPLRRSKEALQLKSLQVRQYSLLFHSASYLFLIAMNSILYDWYFAIFPASLLVLQSVKGRRISGSARSDTEGLLEQSVALSPLQQAVETSAAECSSEVMTTLESHLQALGGLETISASELLRWTISNHTHSLVVDRCVRQPRELYSACSCIVATENASLTKYLFRLRSIVVRLHHFGKRSFTFLAKWCSFT